MKKIYVLDRIEEGTAILISDDEEILKISPAGDLAGHRSGDVFTGECVGEFRDFAETQVPRHDVKLFYVELVK